MSWSRATYETAFDAEAGDIVSLSTQALKILWFNEGQARLERRKPTFQDITWVATDRSKALAADFLALDTIVYNEGTSPEGWRVWGETLVSNDPAGASGAGGARVYYYAEWADMVVGTSATELTSAQDHACLYYALSRFYRRLSSNRAYYKRYSTLVGQNAVSMEHLQNEADRYYQDFLDARTDLEPEVSAFFYERR